MEDMNYTPKYGCDDYSFLKNRMDNSNLQDKLHGHLISRANIKAMKDYYDNLEKAYYADRINVGKITHALVILDKQIQYLQSVPPYLAVQYICKVIGYEAYAKECCKKAKGSERWEEWQEILEWLKNDARNYCSVEEWQEAQKEYADSLQETNGNNILNVSPEKRKLSDKVLGQSELSKRQTRGRIHLMTVHASKGLEFDKVYIPDCNEKIFPHGSMPDKDIVEEERRIFYVAMTRAKKSLELLYLTGTKERPRLPSRFLNPLLK